MLASVVRFSITLFGNLLLYLLLLDSVGFKWATRIYALLYVSCLVLALRLTYLDGFFDDHDGTPTTQAADDGGDSGGDAAKNGEDSTEQQGEAQAADGGGDAAKNGEDSTEQQGEAQAADGGGDAAKNGEDSTEQKPKAE